MSTSSSELKTGTLVSGRYEIVEEIGRGGFGVVYRAMQQGVNRSVALKTLRANVAQIPGFDFAEAFRQEARHTSQLRHPNSITLFDYGETEDGMLWFVTEFLDGETLYERMWREQVVSVKFATHVGKHIAKSLAEAHNLGIIHGDLKPANIFLIDLYGEKDFVKVLDFGIAKIIGDVDPAGMGTPEYMSPEQFSGQPLLAASDIYSLGVIMYEMVMGQRPFDDEDTGKLARKQLLEPLPPMSPEVEQSPLGYIIRRATAKEPANRYADGLALVEALTRFGRKSIPQLPAREDGSSGLHHVEGQVETAASAPGLVVREERSSSEALESRAIVDSWVRSDNPPLIGREADRRWLLDQLGEVVEGVGKIVLMGGAAGVGKTRLAHWLVHEADLPSGMVGGSGEYREGSPLVMEGVADGFAEALGLPMQPAEGHSRTRIEDAVTQYLGRPPSPREIDAVHGLYGQGFAEGLEIDTDAIAELLVTLSNVRPLALHLDNVQSVGDNTLALLEVLARHLDSGQAQLFLLLTVRREALPAVQDIANRLLRLVGQHQSVTPRSLVAMEQNDASELTREALAAEAQSRSWQGKVATKAVEAIVARSHGNPLYALQLVSTLVDEGMLLVDDGVISIKEGAKVDGLIPPKIGGLLRLRVAQLTHRHEKGRSLEFLLLRCALLGPSVPRKILVEFLRLEGESGEGLAGVVLTELRELLPIVTMEDLLVQHSRNRPTGGKATVLEFTQPLIYQILRERVFKMPNVERLHEMAGHAKQRFYQEHGTLSAHTSEIGEHFMLAGGVKEAIGFFVRAARTTGKSGEVSDAIETLAAAVELMGDSERFEATKLRTLIAEIQLLTHAGRVDEEEPYLLEARALAHALDDETAASELALLGALRAEASGASNAEARHLEVRARFEDLGLDTTPLKYEQRAFDLNAHLLTLTPLRPAFGAALATLGRARIAIRECRFRESDQLLKEAKSLFENLESDWGVGQTLVAMGRMFLSLGHLERAESVLQRSVDLLANSTGCAKLEAKLALADVRRVQGTVQETLQTVARDLETCGPRASLRCQASGHLLIATLERLQGGGQGDAFDTAAEFFARAGDLEGSFLVSMVRGISHCNVGRLDEAESLLERSVDLAEQGRLRVHITRMQLLQGRLAAERGKLEQAQQWYSKSIELSMLAGDRISLVEGHAMMAGLVRHKGSPIALPIAIDHLETAQRGSGEMGATMAEVLRASEAVAVAWMRTGAHDRAAPLLRGALAGWRDIGNPVEVERIESLVAKVLGT